MNQVIINTKRSGFTKYNGKIGMFKEIVERTNVNGYYHIVEVGGNLLRLFESDFEWLVRERKEKKIKDFVKGAEEELKSRIANSTKENRQEVLRLLKNEYPKHTGIDQMVIAQAICQLELM